MQRDIGRLQASKTTSARPQPVEAQSKSPMVIDLDSSPPAKIGGDDSTTSAPTANKTMAPFPDMGMDITAPAPPIGASNDSSATPKHDIQNAVKQDESQPATGPAPQPPADQGDPNSKSAATNSGGTVAEGPNSELTFTNMEFTLAPTENGVQGENGNQDQAFDLGTFASADLDTLLPQNTSTENANTDAAAPSAAASGAPDQSNDSVNQLTDTSFDPLTMDFGATDGTDFDFSMDDGNSFNDLMNSHDENFDTTMEHGQFDAEYFGLDDPDNS